jgi:hypothetical protein
MKRLLLALIACLLITPVAEARKARALTDHQRILVLQELVYQLRMQAKAASDAPVFLKHAWPALTGEEKDAIAEAARSLPKGIKFDIVCNDASCSELASDIDDALERAHIVSSLDHAAGPLGYGVAIVVNPFDRRAAEQAVALLKKATDGRLDLPIVNGTSPPGYVSIFIGKRPAAAQSAVGTAIGATPSSSLAR